MTGGKVVVLGEVGQNFGAGMTGGMAFIYDPQDSFVDRANAQTLHISRIQHPHWEEVLRDLIVEHEKATESVMAARVLNQWATAIEKFWQVVPNEILPVLDVPLDTGDTVSQTA